MDDLTRLEARQIVDAAQREEWLTVEYVADHLAVTRQQVYRWIRRGDFGEILKLGRKAVRISRHGYQGFVDMRRSA